MRDGPTSISYNVVATKFREDLQFISSINSAGIYLPVCMTLYLKLPLCKYCSLQVVGVLQQQLCQGFERICSININSSTAHEGCRAATTICVAVLLPRCCHLRLDGGMDGLFKDLEQGIT